MSKYSDKKAEQNARSTNGSIGHTLRPLWLFAVFACVLILLCAAALNLVRSRAIDQQRLLQTSDMLATNHARALARFIDDQSVYLQFLSRRPAIVAALRERDTLVLRTLESDFSGSYATASRLHIVPLSTMGTAAMDFPGHRLNSIETAMIIQAHRGEPVPPEAYKEGRQSVITLLQTVGEAPDQIEGVLLLSLDSKAVERTMGLLNGDQGQLALQQRLNGNSLTVFRTGEAANAAPTAAAAFPENPNWQLEFRASEQLRLASRTSTLPVWALLGGASLLVLLGGLWLYRRLCLTLDSELCELLDYCKQLEGGERALPPALSLNQLTALGRSAFDISQSQPAANKRSKTAAEASTDPVEKIAGVTPGAAGGVVEQAPEVTATPLQSVSPGIFRAYDIRGIVGEDLNLDAVYQIGVAIGSEALDKGETAVIVARDGRLSSEELSMQLSKGLQDSGVDVIDLGLTPTPVLYFATQQLNTASGVMVTGSHNPPEYNGLKVVIAGKTLSGEGIALLKQRLDQRRLHEGSGSYSTADIGAQYIDYVLGDIAVAQPLKVVIDCGNGVAGVLAPRLFEDLGCDVVPLYCDVDGHFPNHHPDPSVAENLVDLIAQVREQGADLGIAFDGDGDRLGVVSASGAVIAADHLLMLFAQDVVSRNPGCDVIFDVKCTRHLNDVIASYGGRPIMWKSGHSLIKQKMVETGALLGGEFSGHIFFKERWFGFDDGLYSAARLIEIMSTTNPNLDQLLEQFPKAFSTPEIHLNVGEERKFTIVESFAARAEFGNAKISNIDGVRVDLPEGWGLLRASNTTPNLVLRFEAESEQALADIQQLFQAQLQRLQPDLHFLAAAD